MNITIGTNTAKVLVIASLIVYGSIMMALGYDGVLQGTLIGIISFIVGLSTGKVFTTEK